MLKCAIPGCEAQEKSLQSGTLQIVDTAKEERMTKRMIWFCSACTPKYVVQSWRPSGEQVQPRREISEFMMPEEMPSQRVPWYRQPLPADNRAIRPAAESRHLRDTGSNALEISRRIWNSRPTGDRLHLEKSQPAAHAHHKGH
jgi:hypothetical protein